MSKQYKLVDQALKILYEAGVLENVIIIGSWCIYFYQHHYNYKGALVLPPLRTGDIDMDVNFLSRSSIPVDIPALLERLDFQIQFDHSGAMRLIHPDIAIDFILPEKGRGNNIPRKIRGFGIIAQSIRFLSFLEDDIIIVNYQGMKVKVPHPVRFAFHKLIISQRRQNKEKIDKDIRQAIEILVGLEAIGEQKKIRETLESLTKKQIKYIKQALSIAYMKGMILPVSLESLLR